MEAYEAQQQSPHNLHAMLVASQNALRLAKQLTTGLDPMAQKQIDTTLTNLEVWIRKVPASSGMARMIPNEEVIIPADIDQLSDEDYEVYAELSDYYEN